MKNLSLLSLEAQSRLLRSGEISSLDLVTVHLAQIEKLNPKLNAFISVTATEAIAAAKKMDGEIRRKKWRGPLHGIPFGAKDLIATKGLATTNGSKVTAGWVPSFDAAIIEQMRDAGAVLLGKTNLWEFGMGSGVNSGFGPVHNPWNLEHSPGGSSSGSAAAVSARALPLALGTDTGGSARNPASHCGITGFKPTYNLLSKKGCTTLSWSMDHVGVLTRSARDCEVFMSAMVPASNKKSNGLAGLRIGIPRGHFFENVEDAGPIDAAISVLRGLGANVAEVSLEGAAMIDSCGRLIAQAEASAYHDVRFRQKPELFDPAVREKLERAQNFLAKDYLQAQRVRSMLITKIKNLFHNCDVLITPTERSAAPKLHGGRPVPGNSMLANLTGIPAMSIPCGFSKLGLPLGMMIHAAHFYEEKIFRASTAYQGVTEWHKATPSGIG